MDTATLAGLANVVRIGLAVTSSSPQELATATFDNVQVIQATTAPAGSITESNVLGDGYGGGSDGPIVADADFDGDGVNDLVEHALGTLADSFDGGWWLTTTAEGRVDAHLTRPRAITGMDFRLESSTDLRTWTPLVLAPTASDAGGGLEKLSWSGITSLGGQSVQRGIVRLRVTHSASGTSVATTPQAWQRHAFNNNGTATQTQTVGVSVVNAPLYAGRVAQVTGADEIALENMGGIQIVPSTACYLEVLDGAQAGHRVEVFSLGAGLAVLGLDSPLSTLKALSPELTGARVVVRPHVTLAQVFPVTVFQAGAVAEAADQVLFHENGVWHTHWLTARAGSRMWISANDTARPEVSQNGRIIPPGTGVMVKTPGNNTRAVTLTGHVRTTPWRMALAAGTNLLALPWPVDSTPKGLGMSLEDGFAASGNQTLADQIQLWQADSTPGRTTYDAYFLLKRGADGLWISRATVSTVDVGHTLPIPAHRAFFLKAQPATAAKGWLLP